MAFRWNWANTVHEELNLIIKIFFLLRKHVGGFGPMDGGTPLRVMKLKFLTLKILSLHAGMVG